MATPGHDDGFSWVGAIDADRILGDARPRSVDELLRKENPVWRPLYRAWLAHHHPGQVKAFDFVAGAGGRPRVQGRQAYDLHLAALDGDFDGFVAAVGELKSALDDRTGIARRLGRLAGKASAEVDAAARSAGLDGLPGGQALREVAGRAAAEVGQRARPDGPLNYAGPEDSASAPRATPAQAPRPRQPAPAVVDLTRFAITTAQNARGLASGDDLDTYLAWIHELLGQLQRFGGQLGWHHGQLESLLHDVTAWRTAVLDAVTHLEDAAVAGTHADLPECIRVTRDAVYWLAYHVDLLVYVTHGEAPHQTVERIVGELDEQQAHAVYRAARPCLDELLRGIDSLYHFGGRALDAAAWLIRQHDPGYRLDELQDWGRHAVTAFRDDLAATLQVLADEPQEPEEPDAVEDWQDDLAQEYFGLPVGELP